VKGHLLVAASALAVGLSFSGIAFADEHHGPKTTDVALSASGQGAGVFFDFAKGTDATNTIGTVNGTGLVNIQQNGGANSVQQDANTLAVIFKGNSANGNNAQDTNAPIALSAQVAVVAGDKSIGAENTTSKGGERSSYRGDESYHSHKHSEWWDKTSSAVGSGNNLTTFGGTGMFNISQNVGNNSLQQSANTVAAVIGK
jgi:hypothetical protein